MTALAESIAEQALAAYRTPLSVALAEKATLCVADCLSGAFEAAALEPSRQAAALASDGHAAVIALRRTALPEDAAFANAVAAHGLVREDMHTGSVAHFGVVVWPTLFAAMARAGKAVSGEDLLSAGVVAYEVGGRVGRALMTPELARLFRPTGLFGPIAAATGAGLLLGLDEEALSSAIALATNCSGGFNEWPHMGGSDMFFHAGFAAKNGLTAARLAREGAFGSPTVFEGEAGLFRAVGRTAAPDRIDLFADGDAEIASVFHKAVPACNYAQTPCQAALAAAQKRTRTGPIRAIRIGATAPALAYPGCDHAGPFRNTLHAKMSIQYCSAAAIAKGAMTEACFADLGDPEIAALIAKIDLSEDPALTAAYPARQGATVTIVDDLGETRVTLDDIVKAEAPEVYSRLTKYAALHAGAAVAARVDAWLDGLADDSNAGRFNRLHTST